MSSVVRGWAGNPLPRLICDSEDDKVSRVMCMEMLSDSHWLIQKRYESRTDPRVSEHEQPSYALANTMESLDLR